MSKPDVILDLRGEVCPIPAMYARARLERMAAGQVLHVLVDHLCAVEGVPAAISQSGHNLIGVDPIDNGVYRIAIEVTAG
jgi:TusA-related sulfurtransferase